MVLFKIQRTGNKNKFSVLLEEISFDNKPVQPTSNSPLESVGILTFQPRTSHSMWWCWYTSGDIFTLFKKLTSLFGRFQYS